MVRPTASTHPQETEPDPGQSVRDDVADQLIGFPPKLYVIGAQKAGTTALCEHLDRLPAVELATPKEPAYFTRNFQRGIDWYRACFRTSDRILLDGTPGYTAAHPRDASSPHNAAAARLHALSPDARLIYIVRDPIRRAWSAYWHAVRVGTEERSPSAALTGDSAYVRGSLYAFQIERYLQLFPRGQVLCVDNGYFRTEPDAVVEGIARWLGVAPTPEAPVNQRDYNTSFRYTRTGALIRDVLPRPVLHAATSTLKALLPAAALGHLKARLTTEIPDLDADIRDRLHADIAADYERFRAQHAALFLDGRIPADLS